MSTQSPYPQQPYQFPTPPQSPAAAKKGHKVLKRVGMTAAFFVTFLFGYSVGDVPDTPTASGYSAPAPAAAAPAYESVPTYSAPAPTYEAPAAPVVPSGPAATFSDGTYEVGVDVAAGRYKTTGPDGSGFIDSCYWARNSNDSGEFSAIIANDNISGPGSITVKSGEFVELSGGCVWAKQ